MYASLPTVHDLRAPVELPDDGILSRAIYDDEVVRVVLFSFAAGQQLSDHSASKPVLLEIVDGDATITLGDEIVEGRAGSWVHLPADLPHSVSARTPVTMLLTLLKRGP